MPFVPQRPCSGALPPAALVDDLASPGLCPECNGLRRYALERLGSCPFLERKPACDRCPVHCHKPVQREKVRAVMRFAGPRMLTRRPWLAVRHLLDRRAVPSAAPDKKS
ncbi:MAG: nitrous oxide-stimulated promoter family protein [Candidatus Aminicenantes bacterium]|nr:nitrous oxide-stimulated promoter family protein [Candidatus Aminicenantes bacterium]